LLALEVQVNALGVFVLLGLVVVNLARLNLATQILHVTAEAVDAVFGDEDRQ